jgi:hypothetical protein
MALDISLSLVNNTNYMSISINYQKLIVNPENYRFDPVDTQQQAIDLMLEEKGEEIFILSKHIMENGLDEGKNLRVFKLKGDNYLVLDGNRRTTALKCLHDPSIIKDLRLKKKFDELVEDKEIPIDDVNCIVYKSEKDAAPWVKLDHTGKNEGAGQDSWGTPEQERFEYKFGGKLSPASQLIEMYKGVTGKKLATKK